MVVSMSITRRGKYTNSNHLHKCASAECGVPIFHAICKLTDFSYPMRGKSLSFYRGKIYKKIEIKHDYNVKMCMLFCLSTIDVLDN